MSGPGSRGCGPRGQPGHGCWARPPWNPPRTRRRIPRFLAIVGRALPPSRAYRAREGGIKALVDIFSTISQLGNWEIVEKMWCWGTPPFRRRWGASAGQPVKPGLKPGLYRPGSAPRGPVSPLRSEPARLGGPNPNRVRYLPTPPLSGRRLRQLCDSVRPFIHGRTARGLGPNPIRGAAPWLDPDRGGVSLPPLSGPYHWARGRNGLSLEAPSPGSRPHWKAPRTRRRLPMLLASRPRRLPEPEPNGSGSGICSFKCGGSAVSQLGNWETAVPPRCWGSGRKRPSTEPEGSAFWGMRPAEVTQTQARWAWVWVHSAWLASGARFSHRLAPAAAGGRASGGFRFTWFPGPKPSPLGLALVLEIRTFWASLSGDREVASESPARWAGLSPRG